MVRTAARAFHRGQFWLLGLFTMAATTCDDGSGKSISELFTSNYLVKLDVPASQVNDTVNSLANEFGFSPVHIFDGILEGFSVQLPPGVAETLEEVVGVEDVVLDEPSPKQPTTPENPAIELGDDEVPESLTRVGAPYQTVLNWDNVQVAVIDTGIDASHPDLNVVAEKDIVGDSTGDYADGTDPQGHGTHVAGTIGARSDGSGVVGVAPGVPLHAVRVLDASGSGTYSDILAGLEYVLDNPEIRVVNMSLGGPRDSDFDEQFSDALDQLESLGVVVCIAAGNEAQDTDQVSPAGLDKGVVVSAYNTVGGDNGFADFSNYGTAVDLAAPGVGIMSTYPGSEWKALDGTSMATPHVAGAAAVYMELNSSASASDVRSALISSGQNSYSGQGGDHPEPLLDFDAFVSP